MNRKHKIVFKIIAAPVLFIMLAFTACDLGHTVDSRLDGAWVALSGVRLEFNRGRFTETPLLGPARTGTFTVDGGFITLHQSGFSPRTYSYSLSGHELTIGGIVYFRDMDILPLELEGRWAWFSDAGAWQFTGGMLVFGPSEPVEGQPRMREGDVMQHGWFRGRYVLRNHAVPGRSIATLTTTQTNGSRVALFIDRNLPDLVWLFDQDAFQPPGNLTIDEWWLDAQQVQNIFQTAAGRAGNLADHARIINAMTSYLRDLHTPSTWVYELEYDPNLRMNHHGLAKDDGVTPNRLTVRWTSGAQTSDSTFLLVDETFWDIDCHICGEPICNCVWVPTPSNIEITPSGIVGGENVGVTVARGTAGAHFSMNFVTEPDPGTYEILWVVSPYAWEVDEASNTTRPMHVNTTITSLGGNDRTAHLIIPAAELYGTFVVQVLVTRTAVLLNGDIGTVTDRASVRVNSPRP